MKKLFLPILFLLFAVIAQAQPSSGTAAKLKAGTRGGACTSGTSSTPVIVDGGHLYVCISNSWTDIGPIAAASLTVGTSPVASGTATRLLYETSGNKIGEISGATSDGTTLTLVAPVLGAATATSINKITLTAPASGSTLTILNGKTATFNNSITFAGTDSTTHTFPTTSATIARTDAGQTFSGANTFTGGVSDVSVTVTGTQPVAVGSGNGTAGAQAFTVTAPAGGDTSSATANARGGNGGGASVTGGAGGQQTGASSGTARGGTGGNLGYTGGAGGAATAVTGTVPGGAGGATNFAGGAGGTSATSTGGAGGAGAMAGGVGGITTAAAVSGGGGSYSIAGGVGGANSNAAGTSGNGGSINIDAGAKGTASGGAASGTNGVIQIGTTFASAVSIGNATGGVLIYGVATNSSAGSGQYGEYIGSLVAIGSPVSLTSATAANITTLSLTAGDWDVEGNCNFKATTATVTATQCGISTTSATLPTDGSEVYSGVQVTVLSENDSVTLPRKRISLSATTTVYMVGQSTFSAGTVGAFGQINARRVR